MADLARLLWQTGVSGWAARNLPWLSLARILTLIPWPVRAHVVSLGVCGKKQKPSSRPQQAYVPGSPSVTPDDHQKRPCQNKAEAGIE